MLSICLCSQWGEMRKIPSSLRQKWIFQASKMIIIYSFFNTNLIMINWLLKVQNISWLIIFLS